jgi:hypothetical protein
MAITAGSDILAADFITASAGAGDSGKAPVLDSLGKLHASFFYNPFGGTGADGALAITSGTTTIDCGNAAIVVKNYSSISITSTGKLAFSNPHANGTIIFLKSTGNVTLTSSTSPCIDASSMGAAGGAGGSAAPGDGGVGTTANFILDASSHHGAAGVNGTGGGAGGAQYSYPEFYTASANLLFRGALFFTPGSGGGGGRGGNGGSATGGAGGRGGGALVIECAGALNFTGTISVNGGAGTAGATASGAGNGGGGGGGGAAGMCAVIYNTLTANSGTINCAGGAGGAGGDGSGGGDNNEGNGGGGGGSYGAAGGAGGASSNPGGAGNNGSLGSGGGGGGGATGAGAGAGGTSSNGIGFVTQKIY